MIEDESEDVMIRTAKGRELPILWIGVADIDGSLHFEVVDNDIEALFNIFRDPEETEVITRIYDGVEKTFTGFTRFKGIDVTGHATTVISLMPG